MSFHSADGSPTGPAPAMDPAPVLASSLFREGHFAAATPHPRIGDNKGGCAYRFTTYRDYDYAVQDGHFGVQRCTTHGSWSGWGLENPPAY